MAISRSEWSRIFISPGDLDSANTTYVWNICVPDTNCYSFKIYDSFGDGICCAYGSGSYNVTYSGTNVVSERCFC